MKRALKTNTIPLLLYRLAVVLIFLSNGVQKYIGPGAGDKSSTCKSQKINDNYGSEKIYKIGRNSNAACGDSSRRRYEPR
jgi:hypothetical protein